MMGREQRRQQDSATECADVVQGGGQVSGVARARSRVSASASITHTVAARTGKLPKQRIDAERHEKKRMKSNANSSGAQQSQPIWVSLLLLELYSRRRLGATARSRGHEEKSWAMTVAENEARGKKTKMKKRKELGGWCRSNAGEGNVY